MYGAVWIFHSKLGRRAVFDLGSVGEDVELHFTFGEL